MITRRSLFVLGVLLIGISTISAQSRPRINLVEVLAGGNAKEWRVMKREPLQREHLCPKGKEERFLFEQGKMRLSLKATLCSYGKMMDEQYEVRIERDKETGEDLLMLNGQMYHLTLLPDDAEVCQGAEECIRLSARAGEMSAEPESIYLTLIEAK
jgi:hypothetical protein